jgi:hypothetical protein
VVWVTGWHAAQRGIYAHLFFNFFDFIKLYDSFGIYQNCMITAVGYGGCSETAVAYDG